MKRVAHVCLGILLLALPASAQLIPSGIDAWSTPADGSTRADFHRNPIPAGFFCADSRAFAGSIAFQGEPIATSPEGALGKTDTIIRRLDDLRFDRGRAETRIQIAALSLVSIAPLKTACGELDVRATLVGEQPITTMSVVRDGETGGTFSAPLSLVVKLSFTPSEGRNASDKPLELNRRIDFNPAPGSRWMQAELGRLATSHVLVDATGNGYAETLLPGLDGSFLTTVANQTKDLDQNGTPITTCHEEPGGHQHCTHGIVCDFGGHLGFCGV